MAAPPQWFLGTTVRILATCDEGDGISVIESAAPEGDSPPLHVHTTEDELFHVLEGELRLRVGDDERVLAAGEAVCAPRGVPHSYRVESPSARWLVTTARGDFERFVRALARPAERDGLPPALPPTPEQVEQLAAAAAAHGIELVGPPLEARTIAA
jgi:quercetin dioxygenase-like cupin family protein